MRNIGIDIGKKTCVVCVMDSEGKVLEETNYSNTLEDAKRFASETVAKHGKCRAICESTGSLWEKTCNEFESVGIPVKVVNTYKMKIITQTSSKTDRIDAKKLADCLRTGMLAECHVASPKAREARQVLRDRIALVQDRTRVLNRLHDLLSKDDVPHPGSRLYTDKVLKYLDGYDLCSHRDTMRLKQYVRYVRYLSKEIAELDEVIEKQASEWKDAGLLVSMPGIGDFTAMLLASEIDGIERFGSPKQLNSWAGLCPRVYQSGDRTYHGRMKKDCSKRINWVMIQAANVAVRHDPRMKLFYEKVKVRSGGRHPVAITHVANKMVYIIWHMLTRKEPYSTRDQKKYARKLARYEKRRAERI